jgi:hypothetical protein
MRVSFQERERHEAAGINALMGCTIVIEKTSVAATPGEATAVEGRA